MTAMTEMTAMTAIAVTGAGGFIGAHLVRALQGTARLKLHLGPVAGGEELERRIRAFGAWPKSAFVLRAELDDRRAMHELLAGADVVVHLAGPPSVARSFAHPEEYALVHVAGTAAVLEAARHQGVRRFIYVSSAEVYGRTGGEPVLETHPLAPRSPYGAAKLGAEAQVAAFQATYGFEALILRPFSVYGPEPHPASLIGELLHQAATREELVLADLRPVRDYCHVDDVARAIVAACTARVSGIEVINLGSGIGTSCGELALLAAELSGRKLPVREDSTRRRPADVEHLIAAIGRAREILSWTPAISLRAGLKSVMR